MVLHFRFYITYLTFKAFLLLFVLSFTSHNCIFSCTTSKPTTDDAAGFPLPSSVSSFCIYVPLCTCIYAVNSTIAMTVLQPSLYVLINLLRFIFITAIRLCSRFRRATGRIASTCSINVLRPIWLSDHLNVCFVARNGEIRLV